MASKGKAGVASKDQAGATAETATDATTETGVTDQPNVARGGEQVTDSAAADEEAGSATATDTAAEVVVTDQPDVAQSADQVTGDAAGVGQVDIDAPANVAEDLGKSAAGVLGDVPRLAMFEPVGPVGYIVRCHRDRGIWRAGRFWPPENVPVPAYEITAEQLDALRAEPLLSVLEVKE